MFFTIVSRISNLQKPGCEPLLHQDLKNKQTKKQKKPRSCLTVYLLQKMNVVSCDFSLIFLTVQYLSENMTNFYYAFPMKNSTLSVNGEIFLNKGLSGCRLEQEQTISAPLYFSQTHQI